MVCSVANARVLSLLLAALLGVVMSACSSSRPSGCTPGTNAACVCTNGVSGSQTCQDDRSYGVCECGSSGTDMGVDLGDMSVVPTDADMGSIVPDMSDGGPDMSDAGVQFCVAASECNDSNACTADDCQLNRCVHIAYPASMCADDNICTDDVCDPDLGCTHPFNSAPCSDGQFCTSPDQCRGGVCRSGTDDPCPVGCLCEEAERNCVSPHGALCFIEADK